MKRFCGFWLLALLGLMLSAGCASKPQPLPIAEWRFTDIDTGKPIPGVWINFAWNGKPDARGMSTCVRGVLAQSDQNGWVRDTAREAHWQRQPLPSIFKAGYEVFDYEIYKEDREAGTVTARVHQDRIELGLFPAWEAKLKQMGYVWKDHYWRKTLPRVDIPERINQGNRRIVYLMSYRSTPFQLAQSFSFVGRSCGDPGAENIGLETAQINKADRERAVASTRYFCRTDWDSISKSFDPGRKDWVTRAYWLMPDQGFDQLKRELPDFVLWNETLTYGKQAPLAPELRIGFCQWLERQSGEKLL